MLDGLVTVAGYLLGMFPTAALIGRRTGHDPAAEGSNNPGASNTYRLSGRGAGAAVLAGDVAKGAIAAGLGLVSGGRPLALAAGAAAVLGHMFPITRRFRGGKGVATASGVTAVLYPLVALAGLLAFLGMVRVTHRASVGSLTLAVLVPLGVAVSGASWWEVAVMTALSVLVVARHHGNIRRLFARSEALAGGGADTDPPPARPPSPGVR